MKYNNTKKYEQEIEPLVKQIVEKCNDLKIPMFFTFAVADNNRETTYRSRMVDAEFLGLELTDDKIRDHLNVMNGFTTIYPQPEELDEIEV